MWHIAYISHFLAVCYQELNVALGETADNADWLCQRAYAHILLKDYVSKCLCVCVIFYLRFVILKFQWLLSASLFFQNDRIWVRGFMFYGSWLFTQMVDEGMHFNSVGQQL